MRPVWCTLFEYPIELVHLDKDVGMLPLYAARLLGCDAWLAGPTATPEVGAACTARGLSLRPLGRRGLIAAALFVVRHGRRIDVLHLFFISRQMLVLGLLFKSLHRRGRLYVKSDWSVERAAAVRTSGLRASMRDLLLRRLARVATLVTAESQSARRSLEATLPALAGRVDVLPNGIDDLGLAAPLPDVWPLVRKERLAVALGRIGVPQKNHDVLLAALATVDLQSWRFVFIGPVATDFRARAERLLAQRPDLASKILFTGAIGDRAALYQWLNRARLSCLPSLWEGFPLALVEALAFGHRLLVSDRVAGADDVTDGGRFGVLLPPDAASAWAAALQRAIDDPWSDEAEMRAAASHARQRFAWSRQVDVIGTRLGLVPRRDVVGSAPGAVST